MDKMFYICDPDKNTECKGRFRPDWCGKECYLTTHKEYSRYDKPIASEPDISGSIDYSNTSVEVES